VKKTTIIASVLVALLGLMFWIPIANAESGFYTSNCSSCHGTTPNTCNGCHAHGTHSSSSKNNINIAGATDKTTYAPGETVSVTITGGYRQGWVRVILYDQNMTELKRSTGPSGTGGGAGYPIILTAPAPMAGGSYTWNVAWYGNKYDLTDVGGGTTFFGPRWTPDPNNPNHGREIVSTNSFSVTGASAPVDKVGIFKNGAWYLDVNGNDSWNSTPTDSLMSFGGGITGAVPVTGIWSGTGPTKIGVFVMNAAKGVGNWYIDWNGNGAWDGSTTDRLYTFGDGMAGAVPATGDWTGSGTTKIGVFANGIWYLDLNGNGLWDNTPTDARYTFGVGLAGAVPVTGDWTGSGTTKIGVFANGYWYLDLNGNGIWDGPPTDGLYTYGGGISGAVPVTGDWTGSGTTKIGVFANGYWYLDLSGNGVYNGAATDGLYTYGGGMSGAVPVTGQW
jgi:hypothetical protein